MCPAPDLTEEWMRENVTLRKLRAGQPVLASMLGLGSPTVAELMANAGYDALVIEMEHDAVETSTWTTVTT